ncbi:flagellar FlbD family protein [Aureliella helgolandensis]|uniref:Flagellar protein (FlbD) n=1 Tax=Aureliella helgolandensis TaxID=2527968 RepID=A0A518GGM4_9BACT|nr:flagellar FlbD family protein [Aureliella helgolandensis]QDV27739.1 Flagellar protein (FlbD) [Aureliella helgolandensis]
MIRLTRLDGQAFVLNADLIRYVEQRPDTYITLTSGERIVVGETTETVVERAVEYQQRKAMLPAFHLPAAATSLGATSATAAPVNDSV